VDEAHLYQGAMGTEFSLLLNRLLSVLNVERDRLQFIITSASLGQDEEMKREYVASLLSLHDEPERKANIVIPNSELADIPQTNLEDMRIDDAVMESLNHGNILLHTTNRKEMEEALLELLFSQETLNAAQDEYVASGGENINSKECHKHILFSSLSQFAPAIRLKRILLRPETLDDETKALIQQWYDENDINLENQELSRIPRRYDLLVYLMFENHESEMSNGAMDILLDLIAGAVRFSTNSFEQKPFLPLRMHLMLRGDNIARCCSGCGLYMRMEYSNAVMRLHGRHISHFDRIVGDLS
jgi:Distinct helicase family with a unique C-terminal domain including a metal-binding cysteine cluster